MHNALRRVSTRASYANVVATLALFIALGGVSYAATSLPKNSVTSKSIKKNAVTSVKIKKAAVTSDKVKNGSLTGTDVKGKSLTGAQINESTLGTVPNAASAASAGSAENVVAVFKVANASPSAGTRDESRAAAPKVPLATYGGVSIYGKCFFDGTDLVFETFTSSETEGSSLQGYSTYSSAYRFGPSTPETDTYLQGDDVATDGGDEDYGFGSSIIGGNGKGFQVNTFTWALNGTDAGSPSHTGTNQCSWQLGGQKIG